MEDYLLACKANIWQSATATGQKGKSWISIFKILFIFLDSKCLLKQHIDPFVYNLQMVLAPTLKKNTFFHFPQGDIFSIFILTPFYLKLFHIFTLN